MVPIITAFAQSPDRGRGLARDTPVRWALEEVGQPYDVRLVSFAEMKEPAHLALQPFGQIPSFQHGDLVLFESGAIVLHVALTFGQGERRLLPNDADACARAVAWMFAAQATIEPPITERLIAVLVEGDEPWRDQRLPLVEGRIRQRLGQLAARLGDSEWLEGCFTAADLMMVSVLRRLAASRMLGDYPSLAAYVARGEARPAFQRAFAAQLEVFMSGSAG